LHDNKKTPKLGKRLSSPIKEQKKEARQTEGMILATSAARRGTGQGIVARRAAETNIARTPATSVAGRGTGHGPVQEHRRTLLPMWQSKTVGAKDARRPGESATGSWTALQLTTTGDRSLFSSFRRLSLESRVLEGSSRQKALGK
jgi:hypothetical protein